MRYIIVANNLNIDAEIENIEEEPGDNLILFNFLQPFYKYEKLRNFKNITVFSRKRSSRTFPLNTVYAGLDEIKSNEDKFQKLIFHKSPDSYNESLKAACINSLSEFGFLNSNKTNYINAENFKSMIGFSSGKALSSGLIAYLYYKLNKKNEDEIILIGFTSTLVHRFHEPDWEKNFLRNEIINKNCKTLK